MTISDLTALRICSAVGLVFAYLSVWVHGRPQFAADVFGLLVAGVFGFALGATLAFAGLWVAFSRPAPDVDPEDCDDLVDVWIRGHR